MTQNIHDQLKAAQDSNSRMADAAIESLRRAVICALTPLSTANKNRVLLALHIDIDAQLEALETETHD